MVAVRSWSIGLLFLVAAASAARAQVADASFTSNIFVDVTGANVNPYYACGSPLTGLTNCTGEQTLSAGAFPANQPDYGAQASASGASQPTVSVSASASTRGYGQAHGSSDVVYEFEFVGARY